MFFSMISSTVMTVHAYTRLQATCLPEGDIFYSIQIFSILFTVSISTWRWACCGRRYCRRTISGPVPYIPYRCLFDGGWYYRITLYLLPLVQYWYAAAAANIRALSTDTCRRLSTPPPLPVVMPAPLSALHAAGDTCYDLRDHHSLRHRWYSIDLYLPFGIYHSNPWPVVWRDRRLPWPPADRHLPTWWCIPVPVLRAARW